ncbi:glucuronate isomerase [Rhodopirellula bahusiensis]|uniref:Glucuronate isomerase n=1 Tax=Rhodopirellula bahusiensis TaxID=2014065 RepID=A0A2G1VZ45_9BACT|nr:glucuronate isomerase [Rhodopirellula bahusiensis]PHQ31880.1 glucuronate isomerase [Rhodopirellula bahusiensis]
MNAATMSDSSNVAHGPKSEIYEALTSIRLIDPHSHINPHSPASKTLADVLGYHYYTELAHSAGMPKSHIEDKAIGPKELVERLVGGLQALENTAQYSWLIEICRTFFGFEEDRLHLNNWEVLYDRSESIMASAQWSETVLDQSNVQAVFLTNDFDDALEGFDTETYIPCLRTDDLVFHLAKPEVRGRLAACTGIELDGSLESLRSSLKQRFEHFVSRGARACAISIPPTFTPTPVGDGRASTALNAVLQQGISADASHQEALSRRVFWTLAELCDEFGLPFDLMIGVNRQVYPEGVFQGQDLYDSRVSLIQYRELFNSFPNVKFPVSVLASVTNQELVSYAWIFPNVITNGHWWYSNTPSFIARDAAARLEAVPQTKQIGYYSDAYKLEFIWPKFDMYRKVLSGVLADQFVSDRGWSIERAVELGRKVLRDNVEEIFPLPKGAQDSSSSEEVSDDADASSFGAESLGVVGVATAVAGVTEVLDFDSSEPAAETNEPVSETTTEESDYLLIDDEPASETSEADLASSELESMDVDALPAEEEVQELGVDDVELLDDSEPSDTSAGLLSETIDDEPLDVGNLLDDDSPSEQITQLRGESSFNPDEDSLQLEADPNTGEFTLPTGDDGGDDEITLSPSDEPSNQDQPARTTDPTAETVEEIEEFDLDFLSDDDDSSKDS